MKKIFLSRIHYPITTLGFGSRIGIWFQGCSIHCPGCISVDTWQPHVGLRDVDEVLEDIKSLLISADGITISGGEPFDQQNALAELLQGLRSMSCGDILVYSGHPWEHLQNWILAHPGLIDVLISDPFIQTAGSKLRLRGSDNQRAQLLTPMARDRYPNLQMAVRTEQDKQLDICLTEEGDLFMAGIPEPGVLDELKTSLQKSGFICSTSQAPVVRS